ncbi:SH3 domain-containing protein [Pelagerythrobacter aerophilus]|uniref:SH3 domain-containing protein n=1 Tax=Pelagerythrobacter aerophilus TaxID=2306995 RepID=UPI001603B669
MARSASAKGLGWLLAIVLGISVLGQCSDEDAADSVGANDAPMGLADDFPEPTRAPPGGNNLTFDGGDTVYVTANSLNGRSEPSRRGSVIATIPHRTSVQIIQRSGTWTQVKAPGGDVWVSSDYISRTRPAPRPRYTPPLRSYGGNCPCSGSNVCIGPRGGRYCITSGGNKRYGV